MKETKHKNRIKIKHINSILLHAFTFHLITQKLKEKRFSLKEKIAYFNCCDEAVQGANQNTMKKMENKC